MKRRSVKLHDNGCYGCRRDRRGRRYSFWCCPRCCRCYRYRKRCLRKYLFLSLLIPTTTFMFCCPTGHTGRLHKKLFHWACFLSTGMHNTPLEVAPAGALAMEAQLHGAVSQGTPAAQQSTAEAGTLGGGTHNTCRAAHSGFAHIYSRSFSSCSPDISIWWLQIGTHEALCEWKLQSPGEPHGGHRLKDDRTQPQEGEDRPLSSAVQCARPRDNSQRLLQFIHPKEGWGGFKILRLITRPPEDQDVDRGEMNPLMRP